LDLIEWNEYYDKLLQLEQEHQAELRKIEEENRKERMLYISAMIGDFSSVFQAGMDEQVAAVDKRNRDIAFLENELKDTSKKSAEEIQKINDELADATLARTAEKAELANAVIAAGLTNTFSTLFSEMAEGELTLAGFFKSMLKGVMSVLPALLTMQGAMNPSTLLGITAGVTAVLAALNKMTQKQRQGFAKGGYVSGEKGKDKIPAMLTHGEYVIPASITHNHYANLERLRYTGQWNNPAQNSNFSSYEIVKSVDNLTNTIKNNERVVKFQGDVDFKGQKYFGDIKFKQRRMAY